MLVTRLNMFAPAGVAISLVMTAGAVTGALAADKTPAAIVVTPNGVPQIKTPQLNPDPQAKPSAANTPDLSAIYYYSRNNDLPRVAAEIRRLQTLYPNWTPPDDIFAQNASSSVNEQPLWDLYAKKDFAGIEEMIASLKSANPDWTPSQDFQTKYNSGLLRQKLISASDAQGYGDVITIASGHDEMTTCTDPDVAWRIAEAYGRTGNVEKATEIYRSLVLTCKAAPERLATAQKASLVIQDPVALDALFALGPIKADGHNEFESVRLDQIRKRLGDYAADKSKDEPTPSELAQLEKQAKASGSANDSQLLGWFYRKRGNPQLAVQWFQLAFEQAPAPKNAEGYALSLRESGKVTEAEELSYKWHDKSPEMEQLFIEIVSSELTSPTAPALGRGLFKPQGNDQAKVEKVSSSPFALPATDTTSVQAAVGEPMTLDRLTRFKTEVESTKSSLGAQSMGWFLYNSGEVQASAFWFQKSIGWRENEEGVVGLALAAKKLKNEQAYKAIVAHYGQIYPRLAGQDQRRPAAIASLLPEGASIAMIEHNQAADASGDEPKPKHGKKVRVADNTGRSVAANGDPNLNGEAIAKDLDAGKYDDVVKKVDGQPTRVKSDPGLLVLKAWAIYHKGDWDGAKAIFEQVKLAGKVKEGNEGLRVINDRYYPLHRQ